MLCRERDRLLAVYFAKVHLHSEANSALVAAAHADIKTFAKFFVQWRRAGSNAKEAQDALTLHCQEHGCLAASWFTKSA
jgi:hypothetical protein